MICQIMFFFFYTFIEQKGTVRYMSCVYMCVWKVTQGSLQAGQRRGQVGRVELLLQVLTPQPVRQKKKIM